VLPRDANLLDKLAREDAVFITVDSFEGSSPREVGAWMLVFANEVLGTVGGGNLEFQAIAHGRDWLAAHGRDGLATHGRDGLATKASNLPAAKHPQVADELRRYPLGPSLGQCCGGVVHLKFSFISKHDAINKEAAYASIQRARGLNTMKIALFGGGHVGKALVQVLGALPCAVQWIDSRDEIFPSDVPSTVECEHSAPVHAAVNDVPSGSHVLIMSFSHAEDLDVVAACLTRLRTQNDLPFIGLIGSKTKWATFRHRLESRGFTADEIGRVTCPIGIEGVAGKEPEVIAVSVAAQLMQLRPTLDSVRKSETVSAKIKAE
jgi:xanthine dehydrogenase accessory factor